jgi:putative aldouronate transport system permease protein
VFRSFEGEYVHAIGLTILPESWSLNSYRALFSLRLFGSALKVSVFVTVIGTLVSLALTSTLAYTISKRRLYGRRALVVFVLITMIFHPGLIPTFLMMRSLGLLNKLAVLILIDGMSAWYTFIMVRYFMGLPVELEESAYMEGAGDFWIYLRIYLPLAVPMIAALSLLFGVAKWNSYFIPMVYINDADKWPLQVVVRQLVQIDMSVTDVATQMETQGLMGQAIKDVSPFTLQMASVVSVSLPMIMIYPFFQRYFVKGLTVGAIKS